MQPKVYVAPDAVSRASVGSATSSSRNDAADSLVQRLRDCRPHLADLRTLFGEIWNLPLWDSPVPADALQRVENAAEVLRDAKQRIHSAREGVSAARFDLDHAAEQGGDDDALDALVDRVQAAQREVLIAESKYKAALVKQAEAGRAARLAAQQKRAGDVGTINAILAEIGRDGSSMVTVGALIRDLAGERDSIAQRLLSFAMGNELHSDSGEQVIVGAMEPPLPVEAKPAIAVGA